MVRVVGGGSGIVVVGVVGVSGDGVVVSVVRGLFGAGGVFVSGRVVLRGVGGLFASGVGSVRDVAVAAGPCRGEGARVLLSVKAVKSLRSKEAVVTRAQWLREAECAKTVGSSPVTVVAVVPHCVGLGVSPVDAGRRSRASSRHARLVGRSLGGGGVPIAASRGLLVGEGEGALAPR